LTGLALAAGWVWGFRGAETGGFGATLAGDPTAEFVGFVAGALTAGATGAATGFAGGVGAGTTAVAAGFVGLIGSAWLDEAALEEEGTGGEPPGSAFKGVTDG
jgi:hypothetical protein